MAVRNKAVVSGRVQGVFFRDTCRRLAEERGVAGYATNLPDGRLEVVFEGDSSAVQELIKWCHTGPPAAVVDDVEVTEEPPQGASRFEVR